MRPTYRTRGYVAGCSDESVLGAAFYLTDVVDGFNASVDLPEPHASSPGVRHAMGRSAAAALARLGRLDHERLGLGDLGRPDGYLERQVPRWLAHLEGYGRYEGYPPGCLPGVEEIAAWLEAGRPQGFRPGILHGDFHVGNLLFDRTGPAVVAIVDWEMCTVGDPLLDLGLLVATASSDGFPPSPIAGRLGIAGGLPTPGELVECYGEHSDRDLSAVDWYVVLGVLQDRDRRRGRHVRACAGGRGTARDRRAAPHDLARVARRALARIERP